MPTRYTTPISTGTTKRIHKKKKRKEKKAPGENNVRLLETAEDAKGMWPSDLPGKRLAKRLVAAFTSQIMC